jgi:hypothetical protein
MVCHFVGRRTEQIAPDAGMPAVTEYDQVGPDSLGVLHDGLGSVASEYLNPQLDLLLSGNAFGLLHDLCEEGIALLACLLHLAHCGGSAAGGPR